MGRHSNLPTLYDFCEQLSVSDLKRWGYLEPNQQRKGKIKYTTQNYGVFEIMATVSTSLECPFMELEYLVNGTPRTYIVYFDLVPSNLGAGYIWYFVCPFSGARCRKLYWIGGYFQHRTAHKGGYYQTQTLGAKDRFLIRQFDKAQKSQKAVEKLHNKYFKRYYKGKPTKRYLKLLKDIEAGGGISETELMMK